MSEFGLPWAESPEQVGLSSARLERLAAVIRGDVARKLIPGAVLAIARGGRLAYAEALHATGALDDARRAIVDAESRVLDAAAKIRDPARRQVFLDAIVENANTLARARRDGCKM